jgi:hypothetical protein
VRTVKLAPIAPVATVTLDGTVATAVLLLMSNKTAPPAGAGPLNLTVPVADVPPRTQAGKTESEESVALNAFVSCSPPRLHCSGGLLLLSLLAWKVRKGHSSGWHRAWLPDPPLWRVARERLTRRRAPPSLRVPPENGCGCGQHWVVEFVAG